MSPLEQLFKVGEEGEPSLHNTGGIRYPVKGTWSGGGHTM